MTDSIRSLIRSPNFVLLWLAYAVSVIGDHLCEFAILGTQGAMRPDVDIAPLQARILFVFSFPFLLFGPLAGTLADRIPRRIVMIAADVARGLILLAFVPLIAWAQVRFGSDWGPVLPVALLGLFSTMFSPARSAMIPSIVERQHLATANAMIAGLALIGTMIGQWAGARLAERDLIRLAFGVDAGTFAASAVLVAMIGARWGMFREDVDRKASNFAGSLRLGGQYVLAHRRVVRLIVIAGVFWFSAAVVQCVTPAIVKNQYQGGFEDIASFRIWTGCGLLVGAVAISLVGNALRSDIAIMWCLVGTACGLFVIVLSTVLPWPPVWAWRVGVVGVFGAGFFGAGVQTSFNALLQRIVPPRFRGRVFGLMTLTTWGGMVLATGFLSIPNWPGMDRWAWLILSLVGLLVAGAGLAGVVDRARRATLPLSYAFFRYVVEVLAKSWYGCDLIGPRRIPRQGPAIVTANHISPVDPLLIYSTCGYRLISFMIAAEYYNLPILGRFIRVGRAIPVRRGENDIGATKTALRRLKQGDVIALFIQGGIRGKEQQDQLKNGVAMLALRTGAPVIPAYISGAGDPGSIFKALFSRFRTRIRFGPEVDLSGFKGADGGRGQEVLTAATRKVFNSIQALRPGSSDESSDAAVPDTCRDG